VWDAGASLWTVKTRDVWLSATIIRVDDDISVAYGDTSDALSTWVDASSDWVHDNTHATGFTFFDLGSDTNATKWAVRNNSGTELFTVDGAGTASLGGPLLANGNGIYSSVQKPTVATNLTVNLDSGNYIHFTSDTAYGAANKTTAAMDILVTDPSKFAVTHFVFEGDAAAIDPTWDGAMTITWGSGGAPTVPLVNGDFLLVTLERWGSNKWLGSYSSIAA